MCVRLFKEIITLTWVVTNFDDPFTQVNRLHPQNFSIVNELSDNKRRDDGNTSRHSLKEWVPPLLLQFFKIKLRSELEGNS